MLQINESKYGRSDPAPSRLTYRLNRFWLRRSFRFLVLVILPVIIGSIAVATILKKSYLVDYLTLKTLEIKENLALRPALKVTGLDIIADNASIDAKIKAIASFDFPLSSLDIDVEELRFLIEELDSVKQATVRLRSDGMIEILVFERKPAFVHKINGHFLVLDSEGIKIDEVFSRVDRSDLPLIVGEGADKAVEEAILLMLAMESLLVRVRGLVRIGERRWDIVLDRNQKIKLPEGNPINAIRKVLLLQNSKGILDRAVTHLDLRDDSRPFLGLTKKAFSDLKSMRNITQEVSE